MPLLTYTSSDFPFQPFTKIFSADVNQCFNDIKTLLNTTKLDSTNIQTAGIVIANLSATGSTAGQFIGSNGSTLVFTNNPVSSQYNVIFGSAAQVTAGQATNSTFASWTQADGDRVLLLPTYTQAVTWVITKKVYLQGLGNTSQITGTLQFSTGSTNSMAHGIRVTTGVTTDSGVSGIYVDQAYFPAGQTFTDNSTALANYLTAIQES